MVRLKLMLFIALFALSQNGYSQMFFGLQGSNFSGINSIYTNPALVGLMPSKRSANISAVGFDISNNYLSLEAPFSLWNLATGSVGDEYRDIDGNIAWDKNWLKTDNSVDAISGAMNLEYRGPSYANTYGRLVWATATRTRSNFTISQMSPEMAGWLIKLLDTSAPLDIAEFASNSMDINANSYQEISAVLSYRVVNSKSLRLSLGGALKGILGLGSLSLQNTGVNFSVDGASSIRLESGTMNLSYTDNRLLNQIFKGVISGSLPNLGSICGFGLGFDAGIAMEIGNNMSTDLKNGVNSKDYKLKVGIALLDIGDVTYNNSNKNYIIDGTIPVEMSLIDPEFIAATAEGSDALLNYTIDYARKSGALKESSVKTTVSLPSSLQIQADYKVWKNIFVGMLWQQRVQLQGENTWLKNSSMVLVPRFEHKWFELSMPISSFHNYKEFGLGSFIRIHSLYFGTDNILSAFRISKYSGINLYMGISTNIN